MSLSEKKPDCFANWERVFPMDENGLRNVSASCRDCAWVKDCLKQGSESRAGLEMRAERLEGMKPGRGRGVLGFVSRWSELKQLKKTASKKRGHPGK